jgi:hypothetical protein
MTAPPHANAENPADNADTDATAQALQERGIQVARDEEAPPTVVPLVRWKGSPLRNMNEDFTFVELPPGRYTSTVERVRFTFIKATTRIVITYRLETPDGVRRVEERMLISAPKSSVGAFQATHGLGRVEDILRICGLTLTDVDGIRSLPKLIEGVALGVVTRNARVAGYNIPVVVRVEGV